MSDTIEQKVEADAVPIIDDAYKAVADAYKANQAQIKADIKSAEQSVATGAGAAAATLRATGKWFLNKAVMIVILMLGAWIFSAIPTDSEQQLPFIEIYYTILQLMWVCLLPSLARLLVFPESAAYAENGKLRADLAAGTLTAEYLHYRFATALCWLATIGCFVMIKK